MNKIVFAVSLSLVISSNAFSYRLNKVAEAGARWQSFPVAMKINPTNSGLSAEEIMRVLNLSMDKWNAGTEVNILSGTLDYNAQAAAAMDVDGVNIIAFSANFREDSNGFDPKSAVAIGGQYGNGSAMSDAFIIFNAEVVGWNTDTSKSAVEKSYSDDLQTIMMHESGHVLGLGHSDLTTAAMSASRQTQVIRELTSDDVTGAKYLISTGPSGAGAPYGSAESGYGSTERRGSSSSIGGCGAINTNGSTGNGSTGAAGAMMLLPMLVLVFLRKKLTVTNN